MLLQPKIESLYKSHDVTLCAGIEVLDILGSCVEYSESRVPRSGCLSKEGWRVDGAGTRHPQSNQACLPILVNYSVNFRRLIAQQVLLLLRVQRNSASKSQFTMPRRKQVMTSDIAPRKRALSPAKSTPSRLSKRIKSSPTASATSKTTPKKSQFFSHQSPVSAVESEIENEESGYEDEDVSVSAISTPSESGIDEEEEEEEYTSEDNKSRKRKPGRKSGHSVVKVTPKSAKGQELWRPGVKTDLAPGEAVFIKLPKAREAGKTPYKDDTIHPNTMLFLQDLKGNNDREWLKGNRLPCNVLGIFCISTKWWS